MTIDGQGVVVGDADTRFTIQSSSKVLLYGLALDTHGRDDGAAPGRRRSDR